MDFFFSQSAKQCVRKLILSQDFEGFSLERKVWWKASTVWSLHYCLHCKYKRHSIHLWTRPHVVHVCFTVCRCRVYGWKRFKNGALMSIDLCTKQLRMLTKMTATYTTVHNELYLRKRQCVCAALKLKWKISFSGIDKNVNKETWTTLNIIVSSLASKCVNQQLTFDWNKSFCHCQVSALRSSFIIFAKGFITGIGVESGGISYDVYLNKTFSVNFRR